ncbi:MAG: cytochrome c5 family protein [Bdellovibrionales bacterium]|nr:cytochrome c5 family protein [Ramlibacter sp.]
MSDNSQPHAETGAHAAHTGPIKNPKQLLIAVFFSFVIPVFAIIGLVYFVVSGLMPAGSTDVASMSLGGITQEAHNKAIAARIQKIGAVEIRDANRVLKSGEEVYKGVCAGCHSVGAAGAPKFGDAAAWAPRIKTGFEALWTSALKGKGNMSAQGGGDLDDMEVANAVVHMANAAGAKFEAPKAPAAAAAAAAGPKDAAAAPVAAAPAAPAAGFAAPVAAPATAPVAGADAVTVAAAGAGAGKGEALYKSACSACHVAGVAGAPKFGDKAAWAPRIKTGVDALVASVVKGKGIMPPRGGSAASDSDIRATVEYMVNAAK